MHPWRSSALALALGVMAPLAASAAASFPVRPLRLLVPNQAGAASDTIARIFAERLSESLGQQVIVDNRAGAGGVIAMEIAAQAAPDGYTMAIISPTTHAIVPHIRAKLPYRPFDDFAPVSMIAISRNVLAVHAKLPAQTVRDFVALAKSKPGQINMASAGTGAQSHLSGVLFNVMAGIDTVHVPYKGAGGSVAAVISGEAQYTINPAPAVMSHVLGGRLRALGVSGTKRMTELPNVPTIAEAGVPGYTVVSWFGVAYPRATPAAIVERMRKAIADVAAEPEVQMRLGRQGAEADLTSGSTLATLLRDEHQRFQGAVKAAQLKAE